MSQHDRQRLWRVECTDCGLDWVGVDKTRKQAMRELSDLGWTEPEAGWLCDNCSIWARSAFALIPTGDGNREGERE